MDSVETPSSDNSGGKEKVKTFHISSASKWDLESFDTFRVDFNPYSIHPLPDHVLHFPLGYETQLTEKELSNNREVDEGKSKFYICSSQK